MPGEIARSRPASGSQPDNRWMKRGVVSVSESPFHLAIKAALHFDRERESFLHEFQVAILQQISADQREFELFARAPSQPQIQARIGFDLIGSGIRDPIGFIAVDIAQPYIDIQIVSWIPR